MQAQVSAIRDVQSVLLRFEAVMETLSSSLAQRKLIEGPMLTATTAIVSGASGTRKSCDEEQKLQAPASPRSKASKAPSYDDEDEVWVPVAPCQPPPRLNLPSLPSVVREENDDAECSRSFLQNVSMGSLSNRGTGRGAAHSASSRIRHQVIDALPEGRPMLKKDERILEVVEVFAGVGAIHRACWLDHGILEC
eukprot:symbB.v1.2.024233.t1/scaffold2249.1/size84557/4